MVSFQGVLKDSLGQPLSGAVMLEFRIFDAASGGNLVDMDGDGAIENVVGQDVREILATAVLGVVSTQFGPVSPTVFSGQPRFVEVTVISPAPATALTRVPMTTSPAVAEQLYARGTTNVAVTTLANGNVGISSPDPQVRLDVVGSGRFLSDGGNCELTMESTGGSQFDQRIVFQDDTSLWFIGNRWVLGGVDGFGIGRTSEKNDFVIGSDGSVGIGTTTPVDRLHVQEESGTREEIARFEGAGNNTGDPNAYVFIKHMSAPVSWGLSAKPNGDFGLHQNGVADRIYVSTIGNVGIGTESPSARLHVVGNVCATGSIGVCSDARFKNETGDLAGALGILDQLRPVRFTWRRDEFSDHKFSAGPQIGFIAQEVETLVPEVVTCGSDGYYSMDYGRLTPVLTAAMQELHAKVRGQAEQLAQQAGAIRQQDQRIETLERELAELRHTVAAIANEEVRP